MTTFHDTDLDWDWDRQTQFAKALATAIVRTADNGQNDGLNDGESCAISFEVETSICECKPNHQKCVEDGKVLGCCNEGWGCIEAFGSARCRPMRTATRPKHSLLEQTCGAH